MAEEFNTEGMLDVYLFENQQLLEQHRKLFWTRRTRNVLMKTASTRYFGRCIPLKGPPAL